MSLVSTTWRSHPFVPGKQYAARRAFQGDRNSRFVEGQRYEFVGLGHSHYDSVTIVTFRPVGEQTVCHWWWHDDEPDSLCTEHFAVEP